MRGAGHVGHTWRASARRPLRSSTSTVVTFKRSAMAGGTPYAISATVRSAPSSPRSSVEGLHHVASSEAPRARAAR